MRPQRCWLRHGRDVAFGVGAFLSCAGAIAQWSGTIAAESDDRYRGVSLSGSHPSVRVTANYDSPARWYAGLSLARPVRSAASYTQSTAYGGWVMPASDALNVDLGVTASHFAGLSRDDFAEVYVGVVARRWSARLHYAPSYYGAHVQVAYAELDAHLPLGSQARLFAHAGALVPLQGASGDADTRRCDATVGYGIVVGSWDLHLAATGVTRGGPYPAVYAGRRAALAAGASFAF